MKQGSAASPRAAGMAAGSHKPDPHPSFVNLLGFAAVSGGWLGPLLIFWAAIWGPLRPFDYPEGPMAPAWPGVAAAAGLTMAACFLPRSYYRTQGFEKNGRLYELLGVRQFRRFVPDGGLANHLRRRRDPAFRIIRNRVSAAAFLSRTEASERSHLVLFIIGAASALHAWDIGWHGWAVYIGVGNVVVNVYPILLQRYTRARLVRTLQRSALSGV